MLVNIQVLRCFAAMAVVLHHAQEAFGVLPGAPHLGFFGMAGVDVFFVVSGFIMFHTTGQPGPHRRWALGFWRDRLVRIAPLYWIATALVVVMFAAGMRPIGVLDMDAGDVATSFAFLPDVRADGHPYPVIDIGWTLNYEMFFYLLFGLTFFLRSQVKALTALTAVFLAGWALTRSGLELPYAVAFYLQPITLEFAAGGLLAILYRRWSAPSKRVALLGGYGLVASGFAAVLLADAIIGMQLGATMEQRFLVLGLPSVMIVAGALTLEKVGHAWRSRTLILLGDASYAIYLFHKLVVQTLAKALGAAVPEPSLGLVVVGWLVAMAASAVAGVMIHRWLELPLTRALKGAVKPLRAAYRARFPYPPCRHIRVARAAEQARLRAERRRLRHSRSRFVAPLSAAAAACVAFFAGLAPAAAQSGSPPSAGAVDHARARAREPAGPALLLPEQT